MKRIICLALAMILCLGLLPVGVSAASAYGYFSGPDTVQAGDTITLTFGVGGTNIYGVDGTISYDSSMLTLVSTSARIGGSWIVEFNGTRFVAYDNTQDNPINGSSSILSATFQVNASLAAGTRISASCTGVTASDGNADMGIGTVTYSTALVQPAEENLDLQSLSVSNGTLSPAFQSSVTNYTVTIPHDSSKANITAVPADSSATVSVSNASVSAGQTKQVTVTVTGESGDSKVYTISVTRENAPDDDDSTTPTEGEEETIEPTEEVTEPTEEVTEPTEKAEDPTQPGGTEANCDLKDLRVDGGELEPAFSSGTTEYTVIVDGTVELSDIIAETVDPEARVQVAKEAGGDDGSERFVVTVMGTDGSTKTYTLTTQQKAAGEEEENASGKCGWGCPCMWLWIVAMGLVVAEAVVMAVLYNKLRKQKP